MPLTTKFIVHRLGCRHRKPTNIQPRLPIKNRYLFKGTKSKLVAMAATNITILAVHFSTSSKFDFVKISSSPIE